MIFEIKTTTYMDSYITCVNMDMLEVPKIHISTLHQITSYSIMTTPFKSIWMEYVQPRPNVPNKNHYQTISHYV
jgi:hypothetical protein